MIELKYTCDLCGLRRVTCKTAKRKDGQDIGEWMKDVVTPSLVLDHEKRSPGCHPSRFGEVMIPIPPEGESIGTRGIVQ